jgi:hypothetical protein
MKQYILMIALTIAAFTTFPAFADSLKIGDVTYDFDAPAELLTPPQQELADKFKDAVNRDDEAALMALIDKSYDSCKNKFPYLITKDLKITIPDNAKIRFFPISAGKDPASVFRMGKMANLSAPPNNSFGN